MQEDILGIKSKSIQIEAYIDYKSVTEAILSTRMVEDKRLRVDVAAILELLNLHYINRIQWIPGHLQLANVMTKQGASGFHLLSFLQSRFVVVVLLFYVHGKHLRSCRDGQLT